MIDSWYICRATSILKTLQKKSVLLLGPRRTGKSCLIRNELKPDKVYNLLNSVTFRDLAIRPSLIREQLEPSTQFIVIDEVQKLPSLLDEVHLMIEEHGIRFLLTGSSARKLRRSYTSLMAGRARRQFLFPLTAQELGTKFDLKRALLYGTLPSVYLADDPWDELKSYVGDYLREEIVAEALSRNIESFARFLQTAAISNGEILNFEKIALDAQVPARTIREYYSILEDTLIGTMVQPFRPKKGRKAVAKAKFYFFDLGVLNSLLERKSISPKTTEFGGLFETWVFLELRAYLEYHKKDESLSFWRTQTGEEVDFVVGSQEEEQIAIEVKSTPHIAERHLGGLKVLAEEVPLKNKYIVSLDSEYRKISDIEILPYILFVEKLWNGELI
jgi:predicted AAA+ superfamily ATPase